MKPTLYVTNVAEDEVATAYEENAYVQKVKEFVTRLYDICLDRKPDAQGLADWSGQLKNSQATGVSVAYGFIFSAELQGKSLSNEDYIEIMYKAFFGRKSDAAGKAGLFSDSACPGSISFGVLVSAESI